MQVSFPSTTTLKRTIVSLEIWPRLINNWSSETDRLFSSASLLFSPSFSDPLVQDPTIGRASTSRLCIYPYPLFHHLFCPFLFSAYLSKPRVHTYLPLGLQF